MPPGSRVPLAHDQPLFRQQHRASSPDARLAAEIARAEEVSMGNPTLGRLVVSDGLVLERCSPSFMWSTDSRYLAVPQLWRRLGFFFGVRLLVADTRARTVYASQRTGAWLQPESFAKGELVVRADPFHKPKELR